MHIDLYMFTIGNFWYVILVSVQDMISSIVALVAILHLPVTQPQLQKMTLLDGVGSSGGEDESGGQRLLLLTSLCSPHTEARS